MLRKILAILAGTLVVLGGCVSTQPKTAALDTISRVALVSLTLDRVGRGPENDPILQSAADFANTVYHRELAAIPQWQVVEAPAIDELDRHFANLKSSSIARQVLDEMAERNQLDVDISNEKIARLTIAAFSGNAEAMARMKREIINNTLVLLQADLDRMRNDLVWTKGKAGIPAWLVDGGESKGRVAALREIARRVIDDYRIRNGLDGVLLVHMASKVGEPGDIRVIVQDNRVLSSIKLNPYVAVLTANGEIALAEGSNRLDDLAPMKLAMPIFKGVKSGGRISNLSLSLADPAGKGREGYNALISETAEDVIGDVKRALQ